MSDMDKYKKQLESILKQIPKIEIHYHDISGNLDGFRVKRGKYDVFVDIVQYGRWSAEGLIFKCYGTGYKNNFRKVIKDPITDEKLSKAIQDSINTANHYIDQIIKEEKEAPVIEAKRISLQKKTEKLILDMGMTKVKVDDESEYIDGIIANVEAEIKTYDRKEFVLKLNSLNKDQLALIISTLKQFKTEKNLPDYNEWE